MTWGGYDQGYRGGYGGSYGNQWNYGGRDMNQPNGTIRIASSMTATRDPAMAATMARTTTAAMTMTGAAEAAAAAAPTMTTAPVRATARTSITTVREPLTTEIQAGS